MNISIEGKKDINTDRNLSPEERHIVQKLLGWKDLAGSVSEFRQKTSQCLFAEWNNSGPVRPGKHLKLIIKQLERELLHRLQRDA